MQNQEVQAQENENKLRGVKKNWSLLAFAREHGNPRPNHGKNKTTNEEFDNLAFVDKNGEYTFVAFSTKLGVMQPKEIVEQKDNLQVVLLPATEDKKEKYVLCKAGNINTGEEIDLFADEIAF